MRQRISTRDFFYQILEDLGVKEGVKILEDEPIKTKAALEEIEPGLNFVYLEKEYIDQEKTGEAFIPAIIEGTEIFYGETIPLELQKRAENYVESKNYLESPVKFSSPSY